MKGLDNEKELLDRIVLGDQQAYKIVFCHYWDHLYAVALMFTKSTELAQDMTQDVFARIWTKREQLRQVEKFRSWLFIIARNLFYDQLRSKTFSDTHVTELLEFYIGDLGMPDRLLECKELETILHQGIQNLPPQQQTAFRLSRFHGLSHHEIALQMGISQQSVKSYMVRSIATLRRLMKQYAAFLHTLLLFF